MSQELSASSHTTGRRTTTARPALVLASRGDALSDYLFDALMERYPVGVHLNPELTPAQRLTVAATTFRPARTQWAEQFYKSDLGYRFRSRNAVRQLAAAPAASGPIIQVHALFEAEASRSLLYVDCTHAQSAEFWPAWNPLRGKALARWYDRERRAYQAARHIFAFSSWARRSLVETYGVLPEQVTVVGAGINLDPLPPALVQGDRPDAVPIILFVGNDFVRKGGPTLLQAFRDLRRSYPQARLRLVGDHPGIADEPGVEVLGRVRDRARIAQLYREATVFCLPSLFDSFGLVLLEAMAYGVPCVTTATGGVPELITNGQTGVMVAPGDPRALTGVLAALLSDPLCAARIGAAGRELARRDYTWERVVDRMAPVVDEVLGS